MATVFADARALLPKYLGGILVGNPSCYPGCMSKPNPQKYKTTNWRCYNAALKSRGSLMIWFDPGMDWRAARTGKPGRQLTFSDAAIQTCLTLKVLFRLPLRQVTGLVESLLKLAYPDWPVPDFSTLSRRQKNLTVVIPYRGSKGSAASADPLPVIVAQSPVR